MRQIVGIDRKIKRLWLDALLDRLVQTTDEAELRAFLDDLLKEELPGKESRAKTIGIILRIWSGIPPERVALRDRSLALLPRISGQERIWLHWGMTALAYPFFRDIAEVVGRLLVLQDDFTTAQVQARMLTTWGDRVTSKKAAQKLITTLADWEVLRSTNTKGHFLLARKITASISDLQIWLLEALLVASAADEIEAQQLLRLPGAFPFALNVGVSDFRKYEGFNIHRQGLDMEMVALRKVKMEPSQKTAKKLKTKKAAITLQPGLFDKRIEEIASGNGRPDTIPAIQTTIPPVDEKKNFLDDQRRLKESINNGDPRILLDRTARFLNVSGTVHVPNSPFSAPSAECVEQFRDGHYFGCIALAHALLEAVIRHVYQVKFKRKPNQERSFEKNLEALHKKKFISEDWKTKIDQMWADRQSFHRLCLYVKPDQQKLEETACSTLKLLKELKQEFFGFTMREGSIIPAHPEYW